VFWFLETFELDEHNREAVNERYRWLIARHPDVAVQVPHGSRTKRMVVVFPAPFGPRNPKTSPRGTCSVVLDAAVRSVGLLHPFDSDGVLAHGPSLLAVASIYRGPV
jgi:hypothetical protein